MCLSCLVFYNQWPTKILALKLTMNVEWEKEELLGGKQFIAEEIVKTTKQ